MARRKPHGSRPARVARLVALYAGLVGLCGCRAAGPGEAPGRSGFEVVERVDDMPRVDRARLLAEARRGPGALLVSFWATWCAPCIAELPTLSAYATRQGPTGVRVVGVALESRDDRAALLQEVLDSSRPSFPMVVAEPAAHAAIKQAVGSAWDGSLPAAWLLGSDGSTLAFHVGVLDERALQRMLSSTHGAPDAPRGP